MDKTEKRLILNEIGKWRANRLLPAEYCDFLINLYSEGEVGLPQHEASNKRRFSGVPWQIPWKTLLMSLVFSTLLLLFVLHFTSFPNWMQMALLLVLSGLFYVLAFGFFFRMYALRIVFLCAGCITAAWFAYILAKSIGFMQSPGWSLTIFVVVLLIWVLTGAVGNSRMIVAAGWTGIGLLYEYALVYAKGVQFYAYAANSVYWIFFAAVSLFIGMRLARANQYTASVWAIFGGFTSLVPEFLYLLSGHLPYFLLEISAFLKISVLMSLLIVFREVIERWFNILNQHKI